MAETRKGRPLQQAGFRDGQMPIDDVQWPGLKDPMQLVEKAGRPVTPQIGGWDTLGEQLVEVFSCSDETRVGRWVVQRPFLFEAGFHQCEVAVPAIRAEVPVDHSGDLAVVIEEDVGKIEVDVKKIVGDHVARMVLANAVDGVQDAPAPT